MSLEIDDRRRLVCEPVTRPDGIVIEIYEWDGGEFFQIVPGFFPFYLREEVTLLGDGNPIRGILRVGQAYYSAPRETLNIGPQNNSFLG